MHLKDGCILTCIRLFASGGRLRPSFQKNQEMEDKEMSEWIEIRIKDFYKDAVGEAEYAYVSREVYEALADTFRRQAHAEEMRDLRHTTPDGYTEGETEERMMDQGISPEDEAIRRMEIETLQEAMQSLTQIQRERLHLYFFEGMTIREIAEKQGVNRNAVWKSLQKILEHMKKFF